jgi:hypothetical protein
MYKNIRINNSIIPSIPFLWYREQQLVCPIEKISLEENISLEKNINLEKIYKVVQTNVLENANIYVCLHTLLFMALNTQNIEDIINIPNNYNTCAQFTIILKSSNIKIINNYGPVHIHDAAFSPCNVHCFTLIDPKIITNIHCTAICKNPNIYFECLFVLNPDVLNPNEKIDYYL